MGIACAHTGGTLELAAQKGFMPLLTWTGVAADTRAMADTYVQAGERAGRPAPRSRVRASRFVYVADSVTQAKKELAGADIGGPVVRGNLDPYVRPGDTRRDLSLEYLIDAGLFCCGDPDAVYEGIKSFYDESGGFGVLLLVVDKDWGTRRQRARSMRRFMKDVAPRLAPLNPDALPTPA